MIEENGRIVAIDADALWVETIQRSTCGACVARKGCGQTLLSKLGVKPVYLRVLPSERLASAYRIGDTITIGVPDDVVVKGSLLMYMVPLLCLLVFAAIAHTYFANEAAVVLAAVTGFALGAIVIRWHAHYYRNDSRHQPVIIEKQPFQYKNRIL